MKPSSSTKNYATTDRPVALVTGGSKGIGFAIAEALAKRGYALVLLSRTQSDLDAAADGLRARFSVPVTTIAADLSQPGSYHAVHTHIAQEYGKLDVLVNNAGDFKMLPQQGESGPRVLPQELAIDTSALFASNAIPAAAFAHVLRDLQLRSRNPKQLDVLSSAALEIFPGNIPYGVTKVAHERVSLSVAAESHGRIQTYRVYPSNTDTRIVSGFSVPKLTPAYVGERAIAMLHDSSATDLYLKMLSSGLIEVSGMVDYGQFLNESGAYDGLGLVRAHRRMLDEKILPIVEQAH